MRRPCSPTTTRRESRNVAKITFKMSDLPVSQFAIVTPLMYNKGKKGEQNMFYYEVKFTNGQSTVILADGDPVDQIPVEFQGDVVNVETICEVSGGPATRARQLSEALLGVSA